MACSKHEPAQTITPSSTTNMPSAYKMYTNIYIIRISFRRELNVGVTEIGYFNVNGDLISSPKVAFK